MTQESASFEGTIAPAVLPRVVRDLWRARATGVLDLRNRDIGRLLVFQKGNIVFAATNQKDERLGERLVRAGKIKRSDLELAFRVMERSNERIGRTVVDLGWLSPMEMRRFVATQIEDIVYSVFSWRDGSYRFEPSDSDTHEELPLQIKTAEVIHEGARRISDLDAIRTGIGRLDRAVAFAGGKKLSIPVTLDDGHILSRVDGIRTLEDIVAGCPLSEEDALRRIYALLLAEVLIARAPDAKRGDEDGDELADRERQFRDSVKARYAALPLGDLYDRLGIDFGATEEQVREGFERVIAALEPEDGFRRQVANMEPMLSTLREKVREAYETLSVSETRSRYDRKFAHAAPGSTHAGEFKKEASDVVDEDDSDEDDAERAEFEYLEAQRLFDGGDYFDAVASLSIAVRLDPNNADYHCLLGLWLSQNPGCWDTARVQFEEAIELDPKNVDAHLGLAELHEHEDDGGDAVRLYEQVLKLDPDNEVAREKLAAPAS